MVQRRNLGLTARAKLGLQILTSLLIAGTLIGCTDWVDGYVARRMNSVSRLGELLVREKDRLVLKPNDEYGGTGVTLGWEADERSWDDEAMSHTGPPRP